jgi:tRNA threonylcarbamoyladenosine modification (KEOPS) complex  Pcc1 subunit
MYSYLQRARTIFNNIQQRIRSKEKRKLEQISLKITLRVKVHDSASYISATDIFFVKNISAGIKGTIHSYYSMLTICLALKKRLKLNIFLNCWDCKYTTAIVRK